MGPPRCFAANGAVRVAAPLAEGVCWESGDGESVGRDCGFVPVERR